MNKWIWFNIGQKGSHFVTWQCAVIKDDFDPNTIRFEDIVEDENGIRWVRKEELSCPLHRSVVMSFKDLDKVAEWVKTTYESGEEQYVGNNNWTHIYDVFDMDIVNEYGVGKSLWD